LEKYVIQRLTLDFPILLFASFIKIYIFYIFTSVSCTITARLSRVLLCHRRRL